MFMEESQSCKQNLSHNDTKTEADKVHHAIYKTMQTGSSKLKQCRSMTSIVQTKNTQQKALQKQLPPEQVLRYS